MSENKCGHIFFRKNVWSNIGGYDDYLFFGGDDRDIGLKSYLFGFRNYLYSKSLNIHIGKSEREDNNKYCMNLMNVKPLLSFESHSPVCDQLYGLYPGF